MGSLTARASRTEPLCNFVGCLVNGLFLLERRRRGEHLESDGGGAGQLRNFQRDPLVPDMKFRVRSRMSLGKGPSIGAGRFNKGSNLFLQANRCQMIKLQASTQ
jgi:hypothetical protein